MTDVNAHRRESKAADMTTMAASDGRTPSANAILVLGMHRSGTSALARTIAGFGVWVGTTDELLPAHPRDNPTGYWERLDLMAAHDKFLQTTGHAWDRIASFDAAHPDPSATRELRERLAGIIATLRQHGRPWLAKDPRLCLLLPIWLPLAEPAACVVVVRDPREVASSLLDTHRGVYTRHFVLALWEKYTRSLLAGLAGRRALFVSYARLLAHPTAQCARLREGLVQLGVTDLRSQIDPQALPEPNLQRSKSNARTPLSDTQAALHEWLQEQARADGPVDVSGYPEAEACDAALAEFEHALDENARRAREAAMGDVERHLARIDANLTDHANERAALLAHNAQLLRAIENVQQRNVVMQQAVTEAQRSNFQLQQKIAQSDAHTTRLEQRIAQSDAHATRLEQKIAQAESDSDTRVANLIADRDVRIAQLDEAIAQTRARATHAEQERDALRRHAEALSAGVQDLRQSWSWRITVPLRGAGYFLRLGWARAETLLSRGYYALPGSAIRKRRLIVWLHTYLPLFTRHTLSYEMHSSAPSERHTNPQRRMDEARACSAIATLGAAPRFSLALTLTKDETGDARASLETLQRQFYPGWELVIVAATAVSPSTRQTLGELARRDPRVRVKYRKLDLDSVSAYNVALEFARTDYVVFAERGNDLARDALLAIAQTVAGAEPDLVYADEDTITPDGRHVDPVFKPDFSLDLLQSTNYIGGFFVVRRALLKKLGGLRMGFGGATDYDLLLRVCEKSTRIAHISQVLHHRRDTSRMSDDVSALMALRNSLERQNIVADVETGRLPHTYRVRRRIAGEPLVSIVLPFRDRPDLLRTCVMSVLEKTHHANFELVGVDNGSVEEETHALMEDLATRDPRVRFVRYDVPFNYSDVVNYGVKQTRGEHLLMLNNDTCVISPDWIEALLEHSQRPEIGAVGALLRYRNDTIQHAGVILNLGGSVAGHAHLQLPACEPGYCNRAQVIQNLSAVTFACAMTRRDVFDRLGGLDAKNLVAAYNDIDYCLRLREAGYLVIYTPYAELYHDESASRPHDLHPNQRARYEREIRYMRERHASILQRGDPYYNPNLSLVQGYLPPSDYADTLPA